MPLLGKTWADAQPHRKAEFEAMENGTMEMDPTPFIMDIIGTILLCYFISWLVNKLNITTVNGGFMLGLYVALGVVVKAIAGHYYFLGISHTVTIIDTVFTMVIVIMVSCIIGAWRKKGAVTA
jgi:hypothetical protein